jgi:phage terminase large subunit
MGQVDTYLYASHEVNGVEVKQYATVCHSTYKDNRFLPPEQIVTLESYKDSDPYMYDVYARGLWGVLGSTIFDKAKLSARIQEIKNRKPLKCGFFKYKYDGLCVTDIQWVNSTDGYIKIYNEPKENYPYVIGGDTAGDPNQKAKDPDYFVGQCIDNTSGEQVAVLHARLEEGDYARQMYCLGVYYNDALIGPETNFSTYPVKKLAEWSYPNLYNRQQEDSITNEYENRYGFRTDKLTRPIIIANLVEIINEHPELLNDITTLEEMLTFVRNEKGRPEAEDGCHDDCVMAMAITYYIRDQQSYVPYVREYEIDWSKVPDDLKEDYENANDAWKKLMTEMWRKAGLYRKR